MAISLKALMMLVAIMATLSAGVLAQGEFGLAPAPSPDAGSGAGISLPVSAAVVASSLVLSLLALVNKY